MRPESKTLTWHEVTWSDDPNIHVHVDHAFYPRGFAFPHHQHAYAEFAYIQAGRGLHHHAAGSDPVIPGDLVFLAPTCRHHLAATKESTLEFWNVTVPLQHYDHLCQRYGPWVWSHTDAPVVHHLESIDCKWLENQIRLFQIPSYFGNPLRVDAFLLQVCTLAAESGPSKMPFWLDCIVKSLEDPRYLRGGVAEMVKASGRSREHFSRSCRLHLAESPQDLLTRTRLRVAESHLRMSRISIADIAERCGYRSVTNFRRQFQHRYGASPAAFRRQEGQSPS